jgi:2-hydroxy-6-oxo-octa-2,4-dienoate hydrolase
MSRILTLVVLFFLIFVFSISLFPDFFSKETCGYEEAAKQYARGKFVAVDGKKVHYLEKGSGSPVILIHGFLYHTVMWQKNIDALAERFKVYAVDLWGFGYSERLPRLDYSFPLYAGQIKGFMEAKGIPKATLVGQSMGGGISVYLAAKHPEKVDRLILIDPAVTPYPDTIVGTVYKLPGVGEFLNLLPGDFLMKNNLKSIWFHNPNKVTDAYASEVLQPLCIKGSHEALMYVLRNVLREPFVENEAKELARADLPILLVHGREDRAVPLNNSRVLNKMWKNSRLAVFERAGHSPHEEHPEKFNALALAFLSEKN